MLTTIIIDRVGKTNVFNLIQDKHINLIPGEEKNSLHCEVDDDLIYEFTEELNRIAALSRSTYQILTNGKSNPEVALQHFNMTSKLREMSEAFFRQFFPPSLRLFFRKTETSHLFFHVDPSLASIPLEILHDGENFLWERFYIGKSIKGQDLTLTPQPPREKLRMLIIADPTEDLEWARREGEVLFEYLSNNYPEKKISLELLGGRNVSKLNLLTSLKDKDIIHFAGHLYEGENSQENGWVLFRQKIIRAREIKNSEADPWLIFSNSCLSGRASGKKDLERGYSQFASSFIRSAKTCYIGTNWELSDSKQTLDFTLQFYTALLSGATLGEALNQARQYAQNNFPSHDLTWASYILMGNPASRLIEKEQTLPDLQAEILKTETVREKYPYPIAQAYEEFLLFMNSRQKDYELGLKLLFQIYREVVFFLTAVILANYDFLKFPRQIYPESSKIEDLLNALFQALAAILAVKARPIAQNLSDVLYQQKDNLYKLMEWEKKHTENQLVEIEKESYSISVQYRLETILHDLDFLKNYGFYLILEPGYKQLSLSGISQYHRVKEIVLPTQTNLATYEELLEKTEGLVGKLVFYNPIKKIFLDLSKYMEVEIKPNNLNQGLYQIHYRF